MSIEGAIVRLVLLLKETGAVLLVGLLLGAAVGLIRGFPAPPPPAPDATVCVSPVPDTPAIQWVSQADARPMAERTTVAFVDARPEETFVTGHVTGAVSVPLDTGTVEPGMVEFLRGFETVIAYDDTTNGCANSTRLAGLLAAEGIHDVRVLQGGMPEWMENGYPAEAGTCRHCP
jgi:3-mercaptopyruvate sulfurtransferase SseA